MGLNISCTYIENMGGCIENGLTTNRIERVVHLMRNINCTHTVESESIQMCSLRE